MPTNMQALMLAEAIAAGGGTPSTWNASDKTSTIALSGSNLVATYSGSGDGGVRSTLARSSGKLYLEYTTGASFSGGDTGIGIATSAAVLTGGSISVGNNADLSFIVFASGNIWFNRGVSGSGIGSIGTATVVGMAIDFTNGTGWFRSGAGNWNGSGTANPATNTGGISISAVFGSNAAYAVFSASAASVVTANFGASAFANSAPSGFSAWV